MIFVVAFAAAGVVLVVAPRMMNRKGQEPVDIVYDPRSDAPASIFDWTRPVEGVQLLKEDTLSSISLWDNLLTRVNGVGIVKAHIAQSGLRWTVGRLTLAMLLGGAASFAILNQISWVPGIVAVAVGLAAGIGPYMLVLRRRRRNLLLFEENFPDALDTLARALRAGNSFAAGLDLLARETKPPISDELRRVLKQRNLGGSWEAALAGMAERVPLQEVNLFTAAVQLQSRTGGRLHEVLGRLAEQMRESTSLRGEIRAIAAHGKLTGLILTIVPVVIGVMMFVVNPAHMVILFTDPAGRTLVMAAGGCLVAAHFVIRRLVDIKI
jgi:tight adherence protein B